MIWDNVLTLVLIALGYGLVCVYIPSLCLCDLMKGKSFGYRCLFYQACANIHLILWGFILGFLKWFNPLALWLALVVFPLAIAALRRRKAFFRRLIAVREFLETLISGMYGMNALGRKIAQSLRRRMRRFYQNCIKDHIGDMLCLIIICAVVLGLYGQYHLTTDGYAYSDESIHIHWEQELLHGNLFPEGMYPHGMHFLVAALSGMFGLLLSRASLIFGCFSTCLLFCTLYLLLKETFSSRAAVLFGILFFLLTDVFAYAVYHRYQVALPMEAALIPLLIMFYALPRYLHSKDLRDFTLFALSVGWCIHMHFYTALAAALACVVFGLVFLIPMIKAKLLLRVIAGGLAGVFLGIVPFGVGWALGHPFHESIDWAVDSIDMKPQEMVSSAAPAEEDASSTEANPFRALYDNAFRAVKQPAGRILLLGLDIALILAGALGAIFSKKNRFCALMLLFWGLNWLLFFALSSGAIVLIQAERLAVFFGFFSVPLFVFPAQLLYHAFRLMRLKSRYAEISLAAASLAFFFFMSRDGYVKDDFAAETNIVAQGDVKTCYRLIDEYADKRWAIISTPYDSSLVQYFGDHFEITDLLQRLDAANGTLDLPIEGDSIYLPMDDIFVVAETKIDQYSENKFRRDSRMGADILENHGDPTKDLALTKLPEMEESSGGSKDLYLYPWRAVVMSKLYYWMEKVKETYPNEVTVYYQDETVAVYHIHQDEYFPLNLMLDYQADLKS